MNLTKNKPGFLAKLNESGVMRGIINKCINKILESDRNNFSNLFLSETPLFNSVYFETTSYCNNDCSFCPVNVLDNPKPKEIMSLEIFEKCLQELKDLRFEGRIGLYNNNEPLTDKRIVDLISLARTYLPKAHIFLYTNGLLINWELFIRMENAGLNSLTIDNYEDDYKLIKPIERFYHKAENYTGNINCNVRVLMRRKNVVLQNMAGRAPNKKKHIISPYIFCHLPFQQFIITCNGNVVICCNDMLSDCIIGNVKRDTIFNIWNSKEFKGIRSSLINHGRKHIPTCSKCDCPGYSPFSYIVDNSIGLPRLIINGQCKPHSFSNPYLHFVEKKVLKVVNKIKKVIS